MEKWLQLCLCLSLSSLSASDVHVQQSSGERCVIVLLDRSRNVFSVYAVGTYHSPFFRSLPFLYDLSHDFCLHLSSFLSCEQARLRARRSSRTPLSTTTRTVSARRWCCMSRACANQSFSRTRPQVVNTLCFSLSFFFSSLAILAAFASQSLSFSQSHSHFYSHLHTTPTHILTRLKGPWSSEEFFKKHQTKSVLCVPLLTQANLIGVLYLENNSFQNGTN